MTDVVNAAVCLKAGGVIAHATEGVWGLACDPFNRKAVDRILTIKGREAAKGMLLIRIVSMQPRYPAPLRFAVRLVPPDPFSMVGGRIFSSGIVANRRQT